MSQAYFATVAPGLEAVAAAEITALGASAVETRRAGVRFTGDRAVLYRVNLWARTLFRVLMPVAEFRCRNPEELYRQVKRIDWQPLLPVTATLAVDATGTNPGLNHSHFTALQVKNAIVDQQRDRTGRRSSVDAQQPDVRLHLHIEGEWGVLSLDSSGESLHRRGYRPAVGVAPLKETLAAGLIDLVGWQANLAFVDPLCGSGTLPLEAALKSLDIAPGLFRKRFGFESWPDFDRKLWSRLLLEAQAQRKSTPAAPIAGSDSDEAVLALARENTRRCGVTDAISLACRKLAEIEPPAAEGVIICNPPYGGRLGEVAELGALYRQLGDTFKQRFKGWRAGIITGNRELAGQVGLRTSRRIPVANGSINCTYLIYELY